MPPSWTSPRSAAEGGIIRPGYNSEVGTKLHTIARSARSGSPASRPRRYAHRHPQPQGRFNQVFGYYIEIRTPTFSKIPSDYQRKQTLKNAERYITPT